MKLSCNFFLRADFRSTSPVAGNELVNSSGRMNSKEWLSLSFYNVAVILYKELVILIHK
ncbi:MAG: hypothetical protein ABI688_03445 [Bacteroidota bacterium]